MQSEPLLLPAPQQLKLLGDTVALPDEAAILLDTDDPQSLWFAARRLKRILAEQIGVRWNVIAGKPAAVGKTAMIVNVLPARTLRPQGYELSVRDDRIEVLASTPQGAFYAISTLVQLVTQYGRRIPSVRISDWPEFAVRGVMLDISRGKVPTMRTLFDLVDRLASWKINQLQLYMEHTFAYQRHREVWEDASPVTGEEILALDAYCQERFIELVPNQNSFGHMTRWLSHDRYRHLAECPQGCDTGRRRFEEPVSLCPEDPASLDFLCGLYDELLPHFRSRQVNVGCDETFDLGEGRSRGAVASRGMGRVYLDFLLKIHAQLQSRGYRMQFWDDIVMGYPELVGELPLDAIALEWGYEADHPFNERAELLSAAAVRFYVCPGTSSWNSIAGRTDNAIANLRNAAVNGARHGAIGYLITDWGCDRRHWQPLPVSYLGLAHGAAVSWSHNASSGQDMASLLSIHGFCDSAGIMGQVAGDLGRAHRATGVLIPNCASLFRILESDPPRIADMSALTQECLRATLERIDQATASLGSAQMRCKDAGLIKREYQWVAKMLGHSCWRGIWALGRSDGSEDLSLRRQLGEEGAELLEEFGKIWLERNRPGGLPDSRGRMLTMLRDYAPDGGAYSAQERVLKP